MIIKILDMIVFFFFICVILCILEKIMFVRELILIRDGLLRKGELKDKKKQLLREGDVVK